MLKLLMRKKEKSNNKGFGLIEVLVAVAIMAIVTLPLANSFVTSADVNQKSEVKLAAITVAENTMERAKALDLSEYTISDDGKYYIKDDQVIENGKTFNVRTTIDPTKYSDINSSTYDLSTLDVTAAARVEVPQAVGDELKPSTRYYIETEIKKDAVDGETFITVETNYIVKKNGNGNIVKEIYVLNYYGSYDDFKNIEITYATYQNKQLGGITITNLDNVITYITFFKENTFEGRLDIMKVYESEDTETDIPYTRINIINTNDWHDRFSYYDPDYAPELLSNAFFTFDAGASYTIAPKDTSMGINVSVYEYINTADESVKYANDSLITFLDGSKFID